jgi:hypothetical protein
LLLSGNSGSNIAKHLKINELVQIVFLREAGNELGFMLKDSFLEVVGNANVEHFGFVTHDVDEVASPHRRKPRVLSS